MAEQVVGRAAERGRSRMLLEVDPESMTPSAALLQEPLALMGGLPRTCWPASGAWRTGVSVRCCGS